MANATTLTTAERLFKMGKDRRAELVHGELVDLPFNGLEHSRIVGTLVREMGVFARSRKLGLAGLSLGVVLTRNPDTVRAPDIAFISSHRLPPWRHEFYFEGPPDLAVEVLSPGDKASEVQQKVQDYLRHGTRLVWVVDPHSKTVTAYQPSGDARVYSRDQAVPGGDDLPGFSLRPADLFQS